MSIFVAELRDSCVATLIVALVLICSVGAYGLDGPDAGPVKTTAQTAESAKLLFDEKEVHGRYYFGDGLGVNCFLTLDPNRRFTFKWHGCLGEYDSNLGTWKFVGDILALIPEKPNKREGFQGMNVRFVPVKWGERHYLVDEHEMPGFCVAAARGKLQAIADIWSVDYVKGKRGKLPAIQGAPLIPERYKEFYEKGPIEAKVTRIDKTEKTELDKGTADRLRVGMLLASNESEPIELEVVSATRNQSVAKPLYYWNSDRPVKVGDRFTTGDIWHRPWGTGYERFVKPPKVEP